MTEDHDKEFAELWQAQAPVDVAAISERLRRLNRLHRGINHAVFLVGTIALLAIAWTEGTGLLGTGGALSIGLGGLLLASLLHHRQARKRLARQWSTEPRALLAFTAGRARAGLWLARMLYAGLPLGIVAGYLSGFALARMDGRWPGLPPYWALLPALALVILAMVAGLRMAARRTRDLRKLEAQLRQFDDAA